MTESKMTKILVDLVAEKDYGVFYLIDSWQQDESKRVREIIKVSDLAEEFKKKEGRFYKQYKFGSYFKEFTSRANLLSELNLDSSNVSRAIKRRIKTNGYYISYEKLNHFKL